MIFADLSISMNNLPQGEFYKQIYTLTQQRPSGTENLQSENDWIIK